MRQPERTFYSILAALFPLFFLLHWNGMLSMTYYWALEAVEGTDSGLAQAGFAFVSSVVLFGGIALAFAIVTWLFRRGAAFQKRRRSGRASAA